MSAASRFAETEARLKRRRRIIRRLHKRAVTEIAQRDASELPEARKLLLEILGHGDVIAVPATGQPRPDVHILLSVPPGLADRLAAYGGQFEDEEDTDGGEEDQDIEPGEDEEFSLGRTEAIDQTRRYDIYASNGDLELDKADDEPSLGSLDREINQARWSEGDRLDRERGSNDWGNQNIVGDLGSHCDDSEPDHDNEPSELHWPMHGNERAGMGMPGVIDSGKNAVEPDLPNEPPPVVTLLPTGNTANGLEMRNPSTGDTVVWRLLPKGATEFVK